MSFIVGGSLMALLVDSLLIVLLQDETINERETIAKNIFLIAIKFVISYEFFMAQNKNGLILSDQTIE